MVKEVKMDLKNEFEKNYKKIIENLKSGNDIIIKQKKDDYKIYINSIKKWPFGHLIYFKSRVVPSGPGVSFK